MNECVLCLYIKLKEEKKYLEEVSEKFSEGEKKLIKAFQSKK